MRCITSIGLTMIAKCIDSGRIAEMAGFLTIIAALALLADIYEFYLKATKE